jgi:YVTN family beta-propeller protein
LTVVVGAHPRGVKVNPSTNTIYEANENSNNVSVIRGSTNSLIANISQQKWLL